MPLSQVRAGMHCTARSVVKGTDITSFDADVVDVIAGARPSDSRILVRASGPAVDATGIGPGFSGSPIYCPDEQGTQRNIGAISEGTNDFGNKTVLATPIEQILSEGVTGPARTLRSGAMPAARPLLAPLTVSGLSPQLARIFVAAGRRAGRQVITVPVGRAANYPIQTMRPGASVAANLASGDLALGSIGTVAYTDGDAVWAFGHAMDGAGRRSLLLDDAYVYTVINNPTGADGLTSYKLAAPGNDIGTVSNDGLNAIVGRVGPLPPRIKVRVTATDGDTGNSIQTVSQVADETDVDLPTGESALPLVGGAGVVDAGIEVMRGAPARATQTMCALIRLRERTRALRFCNRYLVDGAAPVVQVVSGSSKAKRTQSTTQGAPAAGPADDFANAISIVESATFRRLHVTSVDISTRVWRGLRQAFIADASAPIRVRAGQRVRVTLTGRVVRGPLRKFHFRLRIPRKLRQGPALVALVGTPSDSAGADALTALFAGMLDSNDEPSPGGDPGPQSTGDVAKAVAAIDRYDGVRATFFGGPKGRTVVSDKPVFRDPNFRLSGAGLLVFDVRPARRRR
jgi:hypothetical protein